jgi:hypothetical protein
VIDRQGDGIPAGDAAAFFYFYVLFVEEQKDV